MQITPSLPSLPGLLWPGVVASDRVSSMSQVQKNCVRMLNWIVWNRTILAFNCLYKIYTYTKKRQGKNEWKGKRRHLKFLVTEVKNKNVSAANLWQILIGGKRLKRKCHEIGLRIDREKKKKKTDQWDARHNDVKTAENYGPYIRETSTKRFHSRWDIGRQNSEQARVRPTVENEKDNIKVSVFSLSLSSRCFISLCLAKAVNSFFIPCFFLIDDYWEL